MLLVGHILGLDRDQNGPQLLVLAHQIRVLPGRVEPPIALGRVIRLELGHPGGLRQQGIAPGIVSALVLGPIQPIATELRQQDHRIRGRLGQRLLQQSLRGGNGRDDRRVGAHRRLGLVVVSVGQQLAAGGAHHAAQLGRGGRGAAGGAGHCRGARVVHRMPERGPRSRVLQAAVVRMGVAVVGRVRLWHALLARVAAAMVVLWERKRFKLELV